MIRFPLAAALSLSLALALEGSAATPLETVDRFWQAYARGDVETAMSAWDPARAERPRSVLAREHALQCVRVVESSLRAGRETAATAEVEVDATVLRAPAPPGNAPRLEREHHLATVHSIGGEWRIVSWDRREDLLAGELARTPAADRAAKLAARSELTTPRLALALSRWIALHSNRQRLGEAAAIRDLARRVAETLDDDAARSTVLGAETVFLRKQQSPDIGAAIEAGEAAERLALQSGDPDAAARSRMRLARALEFVDPPRAESLLLGIIESADSLSDASTIAFAASQLSWTTGGRLEGVTSFRYAVLASRYAELSGDPSARLNATLNLAGSYQGAGDHEVAAVYYAKAAEVARETNSIAAEAKALLYQAASLWKNGPRNRAPDAYAHALEVAGCGGPYADALTVPVLDVAANRAIGRKDYGEAWAIIRAAHERIYRSVIDERHVASVLTEEANLLLAENRPQAALLVLEEVRALLSGRPEWRWEQYWYRPAARALRALGRRDEAIAALRDAVSITEHGRERLPPDPYMQQTYLSERTALYHDLMALLLESGEAEKALLVAEQVTSRSLQDLLDAAGPRRRPQSSELTRAEREVVELNRTILTARPNDPSLVRHRARLTEARLHLNDVMTREAVAAAPVDLEPRHRPDLERIAPDAAILRYVVAEEQTVVLIVRRSAKGAEVSSHGIAITRRDLASRIRAFLAKLEARDLDYASASRALHRLLIEPLLPSLGGVKRISFVPDDPLWQLPLQTLLDARGRHLLDRFEISYAPSVAWSLREEQEGRHPQSILAVGDPEIGGVGRAMVRALVPGSTLGRLPDAAREARDVGRFYRRSRVLTGDAARESVLKSEAGRYDIVHLATHALIDETQPRYSSIVLAAPRGSEEDGLLEARELEFVDLSAQLVVLSACNTARGRGYAGEGVVGLAWSLLAKGVRHVVVSQWKADSKATTALMVAFHRHLASGRSPAGAMRKAQLELRRDERYADPLYWAPFVVLGTP